MTQTTLGSVELATIEQGECQIGKARQVTLIAEIIEHRSRGFACIRKATCAACHTDAGSTLGNPL